MRKLSVGTVVLVLLFLLSSCSSNVNVEGMASSGDQQGAAPEITVTPVGTQLVIEDLIGIKVYAYYLGKDIEIPSFWAPVEKYNCFGAYLNVENLGSSPIDEAGFGVRAREVLVSVMPDIYLQTPTTRLALNGRFFGDGGTYDNFEQNEMFLMPGAATDNCYVGYDISYAMFDELDSSMESCFLVVVHDGQEYMMEINGAERLDKEK